MVSSALINKRGVQELTLAALVRTLAATAVLPISDDTGLSPRMWFESMITYRRTSFQSCLQAEAHGRELANRAIILPCKRCMID